MIRAMSLALYISLIGLAASSAAQSAGIEEFIEEVLVTGSLIRGTPSDAPSPVDIIQREEIEDRGFPNVFDLIQAMGPVTGVDGRTNQFQSAAAEGTASINLRGLGAARTLVLLNGQRLASTSDLYVNINAIPTVALKRIELLKDGASATYGSDAIAGVANFITRSDFKGVEVRSSVREIDAAEDASWEASVIAGLGGERFNLVASFGYEHRGQIQNREKDWALQPADVNPRGGYSFLGNPGTLLPFSNFSFTPDPDCETVGGVLSVNPGTPSFCLFRFTDFGNLQEEEDHYQLYLESTWRVSDDFELHGELLYASDEVTDWSTSPSFPNNSSIGPDRVVVPGMPHYDDFVARNPQLAQVMQFGALYFGRGLGVAGPAETGTRSSDTYRLSVGSTWDMSEVLSLRTDFVYARGERKIATFDTRIDNLAWAYRGLGGPDCDTGSGVPGSGNLNSGDCYYYNPFTSGFVVSQAAGFEGVPSPGGDDPTLNNPPWLNEWLTAPGGTDITTELLVIDAVLSGDSNIEMGGGTLGFALGFQYREDQYDRAPSTLKDRTQTPCAFGLTTPGDTFTIPPVFLPGGGVVPPYQYTCNGAGPFHFLAGAGPFKDDQNVVSVFGELAVPLTDNLDIQLALRYENYGAKHGTTLDPKLAARWNIVESLSLRASYSSSFRAPPTSRLGGIDTVYQFIAPPVAGFRPVDIVGNTDLEPEQADTYNVGVIWRPSESLYFSLDYWRFELSDSMVQENGEDIAAAVMNPNSPAFELARSKVEFSSQGLIDKITLTYTNGPDTETDGLDYQVSWKLPSSYGKFTVGARGTYINKYKVDGWIWADGFRGEGQLNAGRRIARPLPRWKNHAYLNWVSGQHRVRFEVFHTSGYKDHTQPEGSDWSVDAHVTANAHYNILLNNERTRLFASIYNFTDEDPPLARLNLNYDPYTHDPLGIILKLGVQHSF